MITSLNEWKKLNSKNRGINEINTNMGMPNMNLPGMNLPGMNNNGIPAVDPIPVESVDIDTKNNIIKVGEYAKSLGLSKQQTINIVTNTFINPAEAPEDISVAFVQDHLSEITAYIESLPDTEFPEAEYNYTPDMETNDLPFECAMYVPNNDKIKKLTESLNTQIKKDNFKVIYENNIFFINSLDKLNENNKKIVLNVLKECSAKNISNSLKWTRKIK